MKHIDVFEAKTQFLELLEKVIRGEKFIITKQGVQVGLIIPFTHNEENIESVKNAILAIKKLRVGITRDKKLSILKMVGEGRK